VLQALQSSRGSLKANFHSASVSVNEIFWSLTNAVGNTTLIRQSCASLLRPLMWHSRTRSVEAGNTLTSQLGKLKKGHQGHFQPLSRAGCCRHYYPNQAVPGLTPANRTCGAAGIDADMSGFQAAALDKWGAPWFVGEFGIAPSVCIGQVTTYSGRDIYCLKRMPTQLCKRSPIRSHCLYRHECAAAAAAVASNAGIMNVCLDGKCKSPSSMRWPRRF
jgi:hypothetical protein